MVEYDIIHHTDTQLPNYFSTFTPVALFVGATNGIGRNTIKNFARQTRGAASRVYFVGRSHERGEQLKTELQAINPDGYYEFIPADLTLLSEVDEVCRKLKEKEKSLNLLFMSQGSFEPVTGMLSPHYFPFRIKRNTEKSRLTMIKRNKREPTLTQRRHLLLQNPLRRQPRPFTPKSLRPSTMRDGIRLWIRRAHRH